MSPLQAACRSGNLSMVKFLVESGCSLSTSKDNESSLELASRWNHPHVVEYLLGVKKYEGLEADATKALRKASSPVIRALLSKYDRGCSCATCELI